MIVVTGGPNDNVYQGVPEFEAMPLIWPIPTSYCWQLIIYDNNIRTCTQRHPHTCIWPIAPMPFVLPPWLQVAYSWLHNGNEDELVWPCLQFILIAVVLIYSERNWWKSKVRWRTTAIAASGPSTSSIAATSIDVNNFEWVFVVACKSAWEDVLADKVLSIENSMHGALLLELAASLHAHSDDMRCMPITDCFRSAFVNKLLITVWEKSTHAPHTWNSDVSSGGISFSAVCWNLSVGSRFGNNGYAAKHLGTEAGCANGEWTTQIALSIWIDFCLRDPVMMADQNVPYNITGFTAMKLNLSSQLSSKRAESDSLIKQMTTLEPQQAGHFVDKYDTWICKQSRSGLRYPIPDFYLPVRKLDITCRQVVVSKGLSAFSLNKTIIVKTMLQILMVQHYWKKIVAARIVA